MLTHWQLMLVCPLIDVALEPTRPPSAFLHLHTLVLIFMKLSHDIALWHTVYPQLPRKWLLQTTQALELALLGFSKVWPTSVIQTHILAFWLVSTVLQLCWLTPAPCFKFYLNDVVFPW